MNNKKNIIFFACQLPPPVHGMSAVNKCVLNLLEIEAQQNENIQVFNTVGTGNSIKKFIIRFSKGLNIVYKLVLNFKNRKVTTYYLAVSGGFGIIHEIIPWIFAGFLTKKRIIHHHSFNYCNNKSYLMKIMQLFKTTNVTNIFLCLKHKELFFRNYFIKNSLNKYLIIPNDFILEYNDFPVKEKNLNPFKRIVIGHLSNLTSEKGFYTIIEIFEKLKNNKNIIFEIVGPTNDDKINLLLKQYSDSFPEQFFYLGSLYGSQKQAWFNQIDLFLFPSKYNNEAYPLVLIEAIHANAVILTTPIGCLCEINHSSFIFEYEEYVNEVIKFINRYYADNLFQMKCNDELHQLYNTSKQKAIDAKRDLLKEFFDTTK